MIEQQTPDREKKIAEIIMWTVRAAGYGKRRKETGTNEA